MSQQATSIGGDDGAVDMAAVERDAVEHPLGKCPDSQRILADDQVLELADAGLGGADEAVQRALADAVDAGVGVDLDEQPVLPAGPDGEGLDLRDTHPAAPDPCRGRAPDRLWTRA